MREREQLSGRGSLPARVAEVHLRALSHLEACGEKNVGPCAAMLCVDVDAARQQDWVYSHQTSLLQEAALQEVQSEAKRSRKRKYTK